MLLVVPPGAADMITPVLWTLREEVDMEELSGLPVAELVMGHLMPPPTLILVAADGVRQGVATEVVVARGSRLV